LFSESDIEILDEHEIVDSEEHFYSLHERINIQTATRNELSQLSALTRDDIQNIINYRRRNVILSSQYLVAAGLSRETVDEILTHIEFGRAGRLEYSFQNFIRYQERHDNFRNINRIQARNNVFDFRFHHEHNTNLDNSSMPVGASLRIKTAPNNNLILGQYRIHHGYGLLLHRGSFVSQRPGFASDFRENRTILSAGARPYFSRSFFGVAYEHSLSENFTMFVYGSHKDAGARLQDDKIVVLLLDDTNPRRVASKSYFGSVISFQTGGLSLSSTLNHSNLSKDFVDENKKPTSGAVAMSYRYQNYTVFMESAHSNSRNAHLMGIRNNFQRFTQLISYRHIESGYHADFANFMSNSANQTNEKGLFYKIEFRNREFLIQTFADLFENIEPPERFGDRNKGVSYGVRGERYALFDTDMMLGVSYREKHDKDWRNLRDIAQYEDRTREYWKITWQQADNRLLRTRLAWDFQKRKYPDFDITDTGYALSQNIRMQFRNHRITFAVGVFDTEMPLYLYLYSGRVNNPLMILNGEGQFAMAHVSANSTRLPFLKNQQNLSIELMCSLLKRDIVEYTASVLVNWRL